MGSHKPLCSRAANEAAAISPGVQCAPAVLTSSSPCFWGAQVLAEFQTDRHTSIPPGTWRSPTYLGSAPQPWGSAGIQVHMPQAGWDGARERGCRDCLMIWGSPWQRHARDATRPGRAPVHTSHPATYRRGLWLMAAQPFSDPCLFVCL